LEVKNSAIISVWITQFTNMTWTSCVLQLTFHFKKRRKKCCQKCACQSFLMVTSELQDPSISFQNNDAILVTPREYIEGEDELGAERFLPSRRLRLRCWAKRRRSSRPTTSTTSTTRTPSTSSCWSPSCGSWRKGRASKSQFTTSRPTAGAKNGWGTSSGRFCCVGKGWCEVVHRAVSQSGRVNSILHQTVFKTWFNFDWICGPPSFTTLELWVATSSPPLI